MPRHIPMGIPTVSIADIWAYAARELTGSLDPTAVQIWAAISRTLTDPDSYKADVSALMGKTLEVEVGFPATPINDTLAVDGDLTERTITVALPDGAVIERASLVGLLEAIQDSTTAQVIDVDVFLAKVGDAFGAAVLSLAPALHLPVYAGTTSEIVFPVDVSALVVAGGVGDYKVKVTVDQVAASVKYVHCGILIVAYRMG